MRVFVTGATGALGRQLIPGLVAAGHEVTATTKTPGKVALLRDAGAEPVVVDGLDREAVIAAVRVAAPEVIVHEMTALAGTRRVIAQSYAGAGPDGRPGPVKTEDHPAGRVPADQPLLRRNERRFPAGP
jgi:nucleoside-diphosphate-sugar epimerase